MALRPKARPRPRGWALGTKQPHNFTFVIALILAVLGVVSTKMHIDYVSPNAFWFVFAAYVVLALGCVIVGL